MLADLPARRCRVASAFASSRSLRFLLVGLSQIKGVHTHRPENLQALKDAIRREIAAVPPAMTEGVMRAFRNRLEVFIANDGHHIGDIIFKT